LPSLGWQGSAFTPEVACSRNPWAMTSNLF